MSGKIIYTPDRKHHCRTPIMWGKSNGTIWQCDSCCEKWELQADWYDRHWTKLTLQQWINRGAVGLSKKLEDLS